jgi:hypothetical protein
MSNIATVIGGVNGLEMMEKALKFSEIMARADIIPTHYRGVNCNELLTPYCNELLTPLGSIKTVKIQLSFKFKYILILIKI